jgi:hypothetical protein
MDFDSECLRARAPADTSSGRLKDGKLSRKPHGIRTMTPS